MKLDINRVYVDAKLVELASEASEASKVIAKAYEHAFSLGQPCMDCYVGAKKIGTISIDAKLTFDVDARTVELTPQGIFTCLVAGYDAEIRQKKLSSGEPWEEPLDMGLEKGDYGLGCRTEDLRLFIADCKER
mgnify:CR=1 FL=1